MEGVLPDDMQQKSSFETCLCDLLRPSSVIAHIFQDIKHFLLQLHQLILINHIFLPLRASRPRPIRGIMLSRNSNQLTLRPKEWYS